MVGNGKSTGTGSDGRTTLHRLIQLADSENLTGFTLCNIAFWISIIRPSHRLGGTNVTVSQRFSPRYARCFTANHCVSVSGMADAAHTIPPYPYLLPAHTSQQDQRLAHTGLYIKPE